MTYGNLSLVTVDAAQSVVELSISIMDTRDVDVALCKHRPTLTVRISIKATAATTDSEARHSIVAEATPIATATVAEARINRHWEFVLLQL